MSNNTPSSQQEIETNIAKIEEQKQSLLKQQKKVEDSINALYNDQIDNSVKVEIRELALEDCRIKKLRQLSEDNPHITNNQMDYFTDFHNKECQVSYKDARDSTIATLMDQLKNIYNEIRRSDTSLSLLREDLEQNTLNNEQNEFAVVFSGSSQFAPDCQD